MSKVRYFGHSILWLTVVSLVVIALFFSATRVLMSQASSYKSTIEQYVSKELGEQLSIEGFSATLDGFNPQLTLEQVQLVFADREALPLNIGQIKLSFNVFSLVLGTFTPEKIILSETSLSLKRFKDGHISIAGLHKEGFKKQTTGDVSWLLDDGWFEVVNSRVVWQDDLKGLPSLELQNSQLIVQNDGADHSLSLTAVVPEISQHPIVFMASVNGDLLSSNNWQARGYLKAEQVDLHAISQRLNMEPIKVTQGFSDLQLWSWWDQAKLTQIKGQVVSENAKMLIDNEVIDLKQLSSWFSWQAISKGWRLNLGELSFQLAELMQTKGKVLIDYHPAGEKAFSLAVKSADLNIDIFSALLTQSSLLDVDGKALLKQMHPTGQLNYFDAQLQADNGTFFWATCGRLTGFSSFVVNNLPEVNNLSARACSDQSKGWAQIESYDASIDIKGVFNSAIQINQLTGLISWRQSSAGLDIVTEHLQIDTPHVATSSRLKLNFPLDNSPSNIDMQATLGKAQAQYVAQYLPLGTMDDSVVEWLQSAFKKGYLEQGGILMRGSLSGFPYSDNKGVFQFLGSAKDVDLHYADGWPDVKQADAEVEVRNQGLHIQSGKASIAGNKINLAVVSMQDRILDDYLSVVGHLDEDASGLYTFFKQSALNESLSDLMQYTKIQGPVGVDLDIKIPLHPELSPKVKATALLNNNTLFLPNIDLALTQLTGVVNYGEKGLTAKRLNANVLNEKMLIDIASKQSSTVISLSGELDTATLAKKYPNDLWQNISGKASSLVSVTVPLLSADDATETIIELKSNLYGVLVDLPSPMGKVKTTKVDLSTQLNLSSVDVPARFSYADKAQGYLLFKRNKTTGLSLERGDIHLGKGTAKLPEKPGVQLSGRIPSIHVEEWINNFKDTSDNKQANNLVNQIDLTIDQLRWSGVAFDSLQLTGVHADSVWRGRLDSPVITGTYVLPDLMQGQTVELDLQSLKLPSMSTLKNSDQQIELDPKALPNLDLKSETFFIGESNLGRLSLVLRQKKTGLMIQALSLKSERDELQAAGAWEYDGKLARTGLSGQLTSKSLGSLVKDAGLSSDIKGTPADILFDLHWPGAPQSFSMKQLNGFGQIDAEKGRLVDIEPGLGRVFGLLNLSNLQRRLQLDFSDLVEKGLGFDKIKGRFVVLDGELQTNRFYLESPSSRLDFEGRVWLAQERLDQLITVTPKTTESLPLAGAIAGGPLVGAAVFIAQKIAGKTVNKFAGYQYRVTGPWADPKIEQISQPGGKIFGFIGDVLSPMFDATLGQFVDDAAESAP